MPIIKNFIKNGKEYILPKGEKGDPGETAVYDPDDPNTPLFEVATALGTSNTKAISQKAVTDALQEPVTKVYDIATEKKYLKKADGTPASGDNYVVSGYVALIGGEVKVSCANVYTGDVNSSIASFAFYDSTKTFLSGSGVTSSSADVPANAAFFRMTARKTATSFTVQHYGIAKQVIFDLLPKAGQVSAIESKLYEPITERYATVARKYIKVADGMEGTGDNYAATGLIALRGAVSVGCENVYSTSSASSTVASFAFYDSTKTFLSAIDGSKRKTEVAIPSDAAFVRLTLPSGNSRAVVTLSGTSKQDIYDRLPKEGQLDALEQSAISPVVTSHGVIAKKCYITSTGEESASSGSWRCSPYVELKGEVKLSCNGYTTTSSSSVVMHMAFYDSDKAFISAVSAAGPPSIVDVPSDARYVRMSAKPGDNGEYAYDGTFLLTRYGTSKQDIYDRLEEINMTLGIYDTGLAGKTVAFIGDSITKGTYGVTAGKNYHAVFAQLTGSTDINLGENSAVYVSNPSGGNSSHPRLIDKVTSENLSTADMVVVFAGTNDFSYDSKAIGEHFREVAITASGRTGAKKRVAPEDTDTFSGAVHELILAIRGIIGEKPILIMTPLNRGRSSAGNGNPTSAECNANGDYMSDYVDALKAIGRFYSIPVFDTGAVFNADPTKKTGTGQSAYFYDSLHPNDAGHARLGKLLYKFVANNLVLD